mmetsp:Transcript_71852/g.223017  ORF Transcript_71852/g.223017 Transcript_71852/m.223017 type:complete len:225 (-) Transcript_71852:181-855(-)
MRRAAAVAAAAVLPLLGTAAAPSGSSPPSLEELREKPTRELKAILKSKGAKCKKCVEKDDLVHRVIETWSWAPKEAVSPDGKVRMTKGMFTDMLRNSFKKHVKEQQDGHQLDGDEPEAAAGADAQLPDLEQAWADFSEKLRQGEIKPGEDGRLVYEVTAPGGGSWWERYRMHIVVILNILLLGVMHRVRRKERDQKRQRLEEETAKVKGKEGKEGKGGKEGKEE